MTVFVSALHGTRVARGLLRGGRPTIDKARMMPVYGGDEFNLHGKRAAGGLLQGGRRTVHESDSRCQPRSVVAHNLRAIDSFQRDIGHEEIVLFRRIGPPSDTAVFCAFHAEPGRALGSNASS
eukprot:488809-Rhodomonas_salina.1